MAFAKSKRSCSIEIEWLLYAVILSLRFDRPGFDSASSCLLYHLVILKSGRLECPHANVNSSRAEAPTCKSGRERDVR